MNTDQTQHTRQDDHAISTGQRVGLAPRSFALRITAAGLAVLATMLTAGLQLGIAAAYSGDLDTTLEALKAQPRAIRLAASGPSSPRSSAATPAVQHPIEVVTRTTR